MLRLAAGIRLLLAGPRITLSADMELPEPKRTRNGRAARPVSAAATSSPPPYGGFGHPRRTGRAGAEPARSADHGGRNHRPPRRATAANTRRSRGDLWEKKELPLQALQLAQLELYRSPTQVADLLRGNAPKFSGSTKPLPKDGERAATKLWAVFVLSGVGK